MAANRISDAASTNKNTVSIHQEQPSIPSHTGHGTGPAEGMRSPPAPNLGRSQENPSGLGLLQGSTESHKQEVDGQRSTSHCPPQHVSATTVSSHFSTSNVISTDPTPPNCTQHSQNSPQQKPLSPALLDQNVPPLHVAASQNSTQQMSENSLPHMPNAKQSEHLQNIQKQQQPQTTQSTPPQCHPQSSPQEVTQNTQQHNSLLPPHHVPQNISPRPAQNSPMHGMPQSAAQGAQPGPPQPAPLTSLPPSHPTPLLPSHPSPADHGDQRPSEPTSRPNTEGTVAPPQHTTMKSGPQNGIYKHHQTLLVGSNPGMQAQRGPAPAHNPAMHPQSQSQANGAMGPYSVGNHPHYNQTNMTGPMPPSAHHTYHNQAINPLHSPARHPTYHQQGGTAYSYHMPGQQHPQAHPNIYPPHQYQQQHYYPQLYPQAQAHNQANSRGSYPTEDWHRSHYQPRQPMPPSAYLPVASARGNGHLKESSLSPLGSEGSSGASLVSPGPVPDVGLHAGGHEEGKSESREQASGDSSSGGSPAKQVRTENSERPESPKEILDLDSHNAATRRRSTQPPHQQRTPASAAHVTPGFMYEPRAVHPGMQQGGVPPSYIMSQAHGGGNRAPYPGPPFPDPGCFAAQRPHPHLMEALQRPQQLPYSPGQTRMAMYRHPRPVGHFQGMMIQQRGLAPEHFLHPG